VSAKHVDFKQSGDLPNHSANPPRFDFCHYFALFIYYRYCSDSTHCVKSKKKYLKYNKIARKKAKTVSNTDIEHQKYAEVTRKYAYAP